jgi:hypothetical protein
MINDKSGMQDFGCSIAQTTKWDGLKIMKAFIYALEDSNFHSENKVIAKAVYEMYKNESWVNQEFKNFLAIYAEVDN